jgi:hypothetical protein
MKEFTAKIEVRVTPTMKTMIEKLCEKLKRRPSSWIRSVIESELVTYGYSELDEFLGDQFGTPPTESELPDATPNPPKDATSSPDA